VNPIIRERTIGNCRLIQGDCLAVMPLLGKVDAVVTDPPYGIGASNYKRGGTQYGNSKAKCKVYDAKDWDNFVPQDAINAAVDLTKSAIVFGGNYFVLPPSKCWLVWDKQNGEGSGYADCELAWTNLDKAVRRVYWRWAGMLQKNMGDKKEERFHPTQKPVGVMEWCIGHLPDTATTILDPFMGSGTTLVACAKLGRHGIGIEIDPDYFDIACERVQKAYDQPDFFVEPAPKPVQEALL
jgi:DNA modification methylase